MIRGTFTDLEVILNVHRCTFPQVCVVAAELTQLLLIQIFEIMKIEKIEQVTLLSWRWFV